MTHVCRKTTVALALLAVACRAVGASQTRQIEWPLVQATHDVRTFVDPGKDGMDTPFRMLIADLGGNARYRLECHNGEFDDDSELTFSGNFHCALFAVVGRQNQKASDNLLAEDTPAQRGSDWLNRGRMLQQQLRGKCADTPFGTSRVFRLRGFKLTLQFSDLRWTSTTAEPKVTQFTFSATVVADPSARTGTTERIVVPKAAEDACLYLRQ